MGVLELAPTHSKHPNMTYQQLLHLHCIQAGLMAKPTELLLAQGVNLVHSCQDCLTASNDVSCGGCGSVIAHAQLSPFYPLDVSRVISYTRPSSHLFSSGKGLTAREEGLGTRLPGTIVRSSCSHSCNRSLSNTESCLCSPIYGLLNSDSDEKLQSAKAPFNIDKSLGWEVWTLN